MNIDSYFNKKEIIQQPTENNNIYNNENNNNNFIKNNSFVYNQTTITEFRSKNNDKIYIINSMRESINRINKEINKSINFSIKYNNKVIYNNSFINSINNIPFEIKEFYLLNLNSMNENNKNIYLSKLKNYFNSLDYINQHNKIYINNKKLIFIHNSFTKIKKIPKEISNKINPRNYLIKDEYLIDYDKDSEDEYLEENAEDIKSNDNEDYEEEDDDISVKESGFIVPDGHLSEDELSDVNLIEERKIFQNSKNRNIDIKSILNIRKNYIRPVLIDFNKRRNDENILILLNNLTIGMLNNNIAYNNILDNKNTNEEKFPIVIVKKEPNKFKGIQESIKNHFEDIVKKIHGSYDTKENLVNELSQKYNDISKKVLNNFFKEKCFKILKKFWMIKDDILNQFNIDVKEIEKIKKHNYNIYKEKEEKKMKELEEIKIKNGIIQPQKNNLNEIKVKNILNIPNFKKFNLSLIDIKDNEEVVQLVDDEEDEDNYKEDLYINKKFKFDKVGKESKYIDLFENEGSPMISLDEIMENNKSFYGGADVLSIIEDDGDNECISVEIVESKNKNRRKYGKKNKKRITTRKKK